MNLILAKLFNIKIENLLLYLYTNIQIDLDEFQKIIFFIQNNWISNYKLSFNSKTNQVIKKKYFLTQKLNHIIQKESIYSQSIKIFI